MLRRALPVVIWSIAIATTIAAGVALLRSPVEKAPASPVGIEEPPPIESVAAGDAVVEVEAPTLVTELALPADEQAEQPMPTLDLPVDAVDTGLRAEALATTEVGGSAFMALGAGGSAAGAFGMSLPPAEPKGRPAADDPPGAIVVPPRLPDPNGEAYGALRDNPFKLVAAGHDSSTFSTDVDTASYAIVRRYLNDHRQLPPRDAVRIEELINSFNYGYAQDARPFTLNPDLMPCPWAEGHLLLRVGIQGRRLDPARRPPSTLVFLIDVSGSMNRPEKLGLLKQSFDLLVSQLDQRDRVAIVTYAGTAGVPLPLTPGDQHGRIRAAIDGLAAGGSTAGAAGIREAYRLARTALAPGRQARVILATDGDFNVGVTDPDALIDLVREEADGGVFLNVLGFGSGNYQDDRMERLSNDGDGVYAAIDGIDEARKVFGTDLVANLVTLGEDVKVQLFFNPGRVQAWRLIGYANRLLEAEDFNDDSVDAGEVGAGHQVTALYQLVPVGAELPLAPADPNPFVAADGVAPADPDDGRLVRLRLRYKPVGEAESVLVERDVDAGLLADGGEDATRWAATIAGFGMLLRGSGYAGTLDWSQLGAMATPLVGADRDGRRAETLRLIQRAAELHDATAAMAR